jgi:hypothetical protein
VAMALVHRLVCGGDIEFLTTIILT